MTLGDGSLVNWAAQIGLGLMGVASLLAIVRLVKGPSLPDRVVALDLIATICVAFIGLLAIQTDQVIYLRVAIVVTLIGFLGTVAFAHFVERGGSA